MPTTVIYAIGAGIAGGFSAGVWVGFAWSAFAAAVVVGIAMKALTPKPRTNLQSEGRMITVRQPVAPWEFVLGRVRKAGVLTFRYISADRRYWHMVITLASHECEAIDEIYADGERVVLNSAGFAQGKYAKTGPSDINEHDTTIPGSPYQVTVPTTVTGVHSVYIEAYSNGGQFVMVDVSPAAPAGFYEYSRSGSVFTFHSSATGKAVSIGTYDTTDDSWVRIKISLGDEASSVQPFPELVAETAGRWTQDHKQYGHCKAYIRLEAKPEVFPNGVPNFTFTIRGANDVYDPRTASSGYSANAALCTNWYLTNTDIGPGFDYDEEIDEDDLIAAANDCDDAITLLTGGTEPRYEVNGTALSSDTPKTVLEQLLAACAGTLVDLGDAWRINVGVYHTPTVTLTEDDVAGPSTINAHAPARDMANGVKGIFTSPQHHWQPTDFPAIQGAAYLAEDNDVRAWDTMDLTGFVTSHNQAQRLAKIRLLRMRQALTAEEIFKLSAWGAVPGKSLARTDAQLGWSAKAFEVLDSALEVVEGEGGPVLAVKMQLRETAAAVYDWDTSDETAEDLAPNTDLPDAGVVPVPGQPEIEEEILEAEDSRSVVTRAVVMWSASDYPFGARYELQYQEVGAAEWVILPVTSDTTAEIADIAPGTYDFRVRALGLNGTSSAFSTNRKEIRGLTDEPSDVSGFFVTVHEGRARCHLELTPDLDVKLGGRVWIRWSPLDAGASWNDGSLIKAEGYPGDSIVCEGPLYAGTYMAKFQDSTGHFSRNEASFVVTEALLSGFSTVDTVTFHPTFTGTHVSVAVVDGYLQLAGTTLWDDMVGNLDDQDKIDSLGGLATSGSCTYTDVLDLGSVQTVRLFPTFRTLGFETGDLWDSRTDLMDDWGLVDGGIIEDAEIVPQVRTTDDDPSGAPSWGPWHDLEVADYTARAFEFRTLHTSANATHNRRLEEFAVAARQHT